MFDKILDLLFNGFIYPLPESEAPFAPPATRSVVKWMCFVINSLLFIVLAYAGAITGLFLYKKINNVLASPVKTAKSYLTGKTSELFKKNSKPAKTPFEQDCEVLRKNQSWKAA